VTMAVERCDVLVVGAGPTGLVLAHLLSRYGLSVVVVEQNASTVGEARAVSIDDESLRTVQFLGLADAATKDIASGYGSHYLGPDRKPFLVVQPSRSEYGWPKRNAFRQPLLEQMLAQTLKEWPNVSLHFKTRYISHEDDGKQVRVSLQEEGGALEIMCAYLVGADGGRSAIRKSIGAELSGSSFEERWLIVDIDNTRDPFRETRVFCDLARPCLTLPGPHRTRRYEMRILPHESVTEVENEARTRELLAQFGPDADAPINRICAYTFHARIADRWKLGRVFIAGDAAHLTPPFAGQGMNTGLRDAANLAWKLAAVINGRLGGRILDTYQSERRDHAWAMIRLAMTMGFVMAPRGRVQSMLTRVAFRIASFIPPLRDWLAQMRFKPKPRLQCGFFLRDNRLSAKLGGTMIPQPLVEHEGDLVRLDDVLGSGFVFLCCGAEPAELASRLGTLPERLKARVIGCLPRTLSFARRQLEITIRDQSGEIGELLDEKSAVILLRRPGCGAIDCRHLRARGNSRIYGLIRLGSDRDRDPLLSSAASAAGARAAGAAREVAGARLACRGAVVLR
jgi:3-(3-hydroxy-phenyl)propionate hydroxylase